MKLRRTHPPRHVYFEYPPPPPGLYVQEHSTDNLFSLEIEMQNKITFNWFSILGFNGITVKMIIKSLESPKSSVLCFEKEILHHGFRNIEYCPLMTMCLMELWKVPIEDTEG